MNDLLQTLGLRKVIFSVSDPNAGRLGEYEQKDGEKAKKLRLNLCETTKFDFRVFFD